MIPTVGPVLNEVSAFLSRQAEQDPANGAKFWPVAIMLRQLGDSVDDRVASCLSQAATIRGIVEDTGRLMPVPAARDLAAMLPPPPTAPEDFEGARIADNLERLRAALIVAHSWLETCEADGREAIIARIWDYLEVQAKRESRLIPNMW